MKKDISEMLKKFHENEEALTSDELFSFIDMFDDNDSEEECDRVVKDVSRALSDALSFSVLKSLDGKIITPEAMNVIMLSPNIDKVALNDMFTMKDEEDHITYYINTTEVILLNGDTCHYISVNASNSEEEDV